MLPGMAIMRRLPFVGKVSLIGFLATMPVLVVLWAFFVGTEPRAAFEVVLILCVLDVLTLLYCLVAFQLSATRDLNLLVHTMDQMMAGNLCQPRANAAHDELGRLIVAVGRLGETLSAMVANVRSNAAYVAHAGQSLARDSQNLSERTQRQADSLAQTTSSVEELSSNVQASSQAASQANGKAGDVRDGVESGATVMEQAVASVEGIAASARRMDEIVDVIDGLAFQTNILALNAAVEAARAGESGRGFAVVASEVRSLAQRSADSAREIRKLISDSSNQVATSVEKIHVAGESMKKIVEGIREVADSMVLISRASTEQSSGLSEIGTSARQLDEITQTNAQMVVHAVGKAEALEVRAVSLVDSVAMFRLQQGSPEEAVALVERAVEHRRRVGRDAFLRDVTDPAQGFHDRDMYVFALDDTGRYVAFGGNPAKVGSRVQDIAGIDGDGLLAAIVAQAGYEAGWVEYDITNPVTGKVQTKMSYVVQVDAVFVGCGVYKNLVTL